ncbi:hypothetical protein D0Z00_000273 [Geotrichum galactomycetum]|uniref:Uncharacterized protein n=1 Tax=Geotrichum galactomycetum TaxID=27317 RepID=A0ACB6VA83_9ASCO|nr:hypothetical protein D0Z00_000273 [Geotrichum candidum]
MLETSCGSPHYASPEIVGGKSYHGAPSDIWSCGIILFALLTGHLPFDDDNIRKLLYKVQEGKFHMPPQLSPQAKDLIWKMLKVKPEDRITMPDILKHSLLRKYPAKLSSRGRSESSDFVSMLEQAFNFDKKQAATSRALSNPINPASTAYSESNRRVVSEPHKDYVNHDVAPKLTKSPTYQYSSSFDTSSVREIPPPGTPSIINVASTTTLPLKNNSDVYLPIELEEDRFADAIEEEMDLHLKKSNDISSNYNNNNNNNNTNNNNNNNNSTDLNLREFAHQ